MKWLVIPLKAYHTHHTPCDTVKPCNKQNALEIYILHVQVVALFTLSS